MIRLMFVMLDTREMFVLSCLTERITKSLAQLFSVSVTANSRYTTVDLAIGQKLIFNLDITILTTSQHDNTITTPLTFNSPTRYIHGKLTCSFVASVFLWLDKMHCVEEEYRL